MYIEPIEKSMGLISVDSFGVRNSNKSICISNIVNAVTHYKTLFDVDFHGNSFSHSYYDLTCHHFLELQDRSTFELYSLLTISKLISIAKRHMITNLCISSKDERILECLFQKGFEIRASKDRDKVRFYGRKELK